MRNYSIEIRLVEYSILLFPWSGVGDDSWVPLSLRNSRVLKAEHPFELI